MFKRSIFSSFVIPVGVSLLLATCEGTNKGDIADLDFNWHVRPILSENCFKCHGTDKEGVEAGLRLDLAESATNELPESPGKFAIVPGKPSKSELVRRINSSDPDVVMPHSDSGKVLTDREKEILTQWIADGAEYKPHWAFVSLQAVEVPESKYDSQAINKVDQFIFKRLEDEGLAPSASADKEALINRVSLTLTGLPPSLSEVAAFVKDDDPNAYEHLVDRILASPAYGEHMARYWMDLARWADTDGFLDDHHDRLLWPWRDWAISAFNQNMPFDQFGTEQLAGDLLPNADRDQILATAFLRLGKRTTENGAIDAEYISEYMVDRVETVSTAFLGLTAGCARCHDHRYDPITQRDFYSFGAFFHSIDEPGFYAPGWSGIQGGPTLPWTDSETDEKIELATAEIGKRETEFGDAVSAASAEAEEKAEMIVNLPDSVSDLLSTSLSESTDSYHSFDEVVSLDPDQLPVPPGYGELPDELVSQYFDIKQFLPDEVFATANNPVPGHFIRDLTVVSPSGLPDGIPALLQSPLLKPGIRGNALFFDKTNHGSLLGGAGQYDRTQAFSVDLWFFAGQDYPHWVPILSHRNGDNLGGVGYRLQLGDDKRIRVYLAHSRPANMIELRSVEPVEVKEWLHISLTYNGSSRADGTKLYINGTIAEVEVKRDTLTRTMLPTMLGSAIEPYTNLSFGVAFREKPPEDSGLDELRLFNKELSGLEVAWLHDSEAVLQKDYQTLKSGLLDVLVAKDSRVTQALAKLTTAREAHNQIVSRVPQVLVAGDSPEPRDTHVLERGVYTNIGEKVSARGYEDIFPWDTSLPENRIGLSEWLFDTANPLTARVWVNRMWQQHMGRGLVETAENFGSQGALPTHPRLLDWLAYNFT